MTSNRREEESDGGRARSRGRHRRSLSGNVTNNRRADSQRINRRWVRGMGGGATILIHVSDSDTSKNNCRKYPQSLLRCWSKHHILSLLHVFVILFSHTSIHSPLSLNSHHLHVLEWTLRSQSILIRIQKILHGL